MTLAPGPDAHESSQDFLGLCLLGGDCKLEQGTRRVKRRAILVSIVLQILVVAALVLLPLPGDTENIAARVLVYPQVPYSPARAPHLPDQRPIPRHNDAHFFQPDQIPQVIVDRDLTPPTPPQFSDAGGDNDISRDMIGDRPSTGIPFSNSSDRPTPPEQPRTPPPPHIVRVSGLVQEAKLLSRVQPIYPPLAVQTRREGRVELHAIIGTDGSIQWLEVLSGDALFIESALTAVRQWRYTPTTLSGQPLEVDTHITVIYTLAH